MYLLSLLTQVSRIKVALIIAALISCLMLSVSARIWFASATISHQAFVPMEASSTVVSRPFATTTATQGKPDERIEVELVVVTPQGFEPAEVTRLHEPFILAVHNNSGAPTLSLQLDRVQGERIHEMRLRLGERRSHQRLNLPPGDYILSETDHPGWRCLIRIHN
jgi:hypothetical protein